MKTHSLTQGSPEWLSYRATMRNASDAPAMMGCSPYKTRAELLREMHTGVAAEVDIGTQKRFDNGHRVEALARPLAEKIIGEDLYPVTGSLGMLSASFDGLTLAETEGFEHKALNDAIRAAFKAMAVQRVDMQEEGRLLPIYHRVQMEQQLHVSGAERILFMSSEWTAEGELVEEMHCWYYPDAELRAAILNGWAQFDADLAAYTLPPAAAPGATGKAPDTLPALRIEVNGAVTASNLPEWKATALGAIRSVNRTLATDQDFADADKAIKWCADVEAKVKAAKEHALSQTSSIDELFRALDDIAAESKTVRLDLSRLVTSRKGEVRDTAVSAARKVLDRHIAAHNSELAPMALRPVAADFAGAIKGLRSIASMQDALDTTLAAGKIAADEQARSIRANVAAFKAAADGLEFLFADLGQLVHKAPDDFGAVLQARIATHRAAEAERARKAAEAEAQRIAAQQAEDARVAALAAQREQDAAAEAARIAAAVVPERQASQQVLKAEPAMADATDRVVPAITSPRGGAMGAWQAAAEAPAVDDGPATLTLGAICSRLDPDGGLVLRGAFLADRLHIKPARTERGVGFYSESQYQRICAQLAIHIAAAAELHVELAA